MKALTNIALPKAIEEHLKNCCKEDGKQYKTSPLTVASCPAYEISDYQSLVSLIGRLAALNQKTVLLFRGQGEDYGFRRGKKGSDLYPSIYRDLKGGGGSESRRELQKRFNQLHEASDCLLDQIKRLKQQAKLDGDESKMFNRKLVRWAALQHYRVLNSGTPLLDVTQSIRVACWFAFNDSQGEPTPAPTFYVFGMPYLTGPVMLDITEELYGMRLTGLMPPIVERPFFQEGYLFASEFYGPDSIQIADCNFSRRLIAKFDLVTTGKSDWKDVIGGINPNMIEPSGSQDFFAGVAEDIKNTCGKLE